MIYAYDTPPAGTMPFHPVDRDSGERLNLLIDERTFIPNAQQWSILVEDVISEAIYRVWHTSTGTPQETAHMYARRVGYVSQAHVPLSGAWCECGQLPDDPIYLTDGVCPCGEWKDHYHCPDCKCICQVG
jgi:hypothetical protein